MVTMVTMITHYIQFVSCHGNYNLLAAPLELPLLVVAVEKLSGSVVVSTLQVKVEESPASRNSVLFAAVVSSVTAAWDKWC